MFSNNDLPADILKMMDDDVIFLQDNEINAQTAKKLSQALKTKKDYMLDLSSNSLCDEGGMAISLLKVKGLGLARTLITDKTLKAILTNDSLMYLNVGGNDITDQAFLDESILQLDKLEALDLSRTQITDQTLAILSRLSNLKLLIIDFNSNLSVYGIKNLMRIPSLCYLQAIGCNLDDAAENEIGAFNKKHIAVTSELTVNQPIVTISTDLVPPKISSKNNLPVG